MNWAEAVSAMRKGESVQRRSEQYRIKGRGGVWQLGEEPMRLAHAWSHDEKAVVVFQGVHSRCLFVPTNEQMNAVDYVVVPDNSAAGEVHQ